MTNWDPADPVDATALAWLRERPGTPVAGIGIVTRIWRLAKMFGEDRRRLLAAEGADAATLDLLSVLRRSGPPYALTTRELAARSRVTAGAISQRLTRAEAEGLVRREPARREAVRREPDGSRAASPARREPVRHDLDGSRADGSRADGSRQVLVTLTDRGHAQVEQLVDRVLGREADLVARLRPEQRDQLTELLRILLTDLDQRVEHQPHSQVGSQ
ncbi:MAG TPA: MarR family transcriptional regulator [Pseudonocardia sp.]|nr:MarR family transcriptional regulator [Pseudonocardia sp.]